MPNQDNYSEWNAMPEFIQEAQKPFAMINFRFETEEDLKAFSDLIGQPLTPKTKSAWHPRLQRGKNANLRYVDGEK